MPRVKVKTRSTRGAERHCGKCGDEIKPGQKYRQWEFRYAGKRYRCMKGACAPRMSDLTLSKFGEVYAAHEALEDSLATDFTTTDEVQSWIDECAGEANRIAEEYEAAAEPFGGAGENMERAEMVQGFAQELESITLPELPTEGDEDTIRLEAEKRWLFEELPPEAQDELRTFEALPDDALARGDYARKFDIDTQERLDDLEDYIEEYLATYADRLGEWREEVRSEVLGVEMQF